MKEEEFSTEENAGRFLDAMLWRHKEPGTKVKSIMEFKDAGFRDLLRKCREFRHKFNDDNEGIARITRLYIDKDADPDRFHIQVGVRQKHRRTTEDMIDEIDSTMIDEIGADSEDQAEFPEDAQAFLLRYSYPKGAGK